MQKIIVSVCALFLLGCVDSSTPTAVEPEGSFLQNVVLEETYMSSEPLDFPDEVVPNNPQRDKIIEAQIGAQTFQLEVSDTQETREMGLMHREAMQYDEGMLFVFDAPARHRFWMKNTLIPLDILWLDENKTVIHFESAVPCYQDPCSIYGPMDIAKYVIELPAGSFVEEVGVGVEF